MQMTLLDWWWFSIWQHEPTFLSSWMLGCFWEVTLEFAEVSQNKQTCLYTNCSFPRMYGSVLSDTVNVCWSLYSVRLTGFLVVNDSTTPDPMFLRLIKSDWCLLSVWGCEFYLWVMQQISWTLPGRVVLLLHVDVPTCWIQTTSL